MRKGEFLWEGPRPSNYLWNKMLKSYRPSREKGKVLKVLTILDILKNKDWLAQNDLFSFLDGKSFARVNEIEKKAKKLSLLELTEKTCKWPVGDPATEDFWFCGLATQSGKPYCEAHVGVAFQPMNSRRDRRRS